MDAVYVGLALAFFCSLAWVVQRAGPRAEQ
jgi:hypothetical protein